MTTIAIYNAGLATRALPKLRNFSHRLADALNHAVAYRLRHAVPEAELRRARREIRRLTRNTT